jgi:hypothetical protein
MLFLVALFLLSRMSEPPVDIDPTQDRPFSIGLRPAWLIRSLLAFLFLMSLLFIFHRLIAALSGLTATFTGSPCDIGFQEDLGSATRVQQLLGATSLICACLREPTMQLERGFNCANSRPKDNDGKKDVVASTDVCSDAIAEGDDCSN